MKIRQIIPVTSDFAVLASRRDDFKRRCYDKQGDNHNYFWAIVDSLGEDYIELIDVEVDGNQHICDRSLVVPRKPCPICHHQMEPIYDLRHTPFFWQECPSCGYELDMTASYQVDDDDLEEDEEDDDGGESHEG